MGNKFSSESKNNKRGKVHFLPFFISLAVILLQRRGKRLLTVLRNHVTVGPYRQFPPPPHLNKIASKTDASGNKEHGRILTNSEGKSFSCERQRLAK